MFRPGSYRADGGPKTVQNLFRERIFVLKSFGFFPQMVFQSFERRGIKYLGAEKSVDGAGFQLFQYGIEVVF